jgi:hypothetical protein
MLVTVTNTTSPGRTINRLDSVEGATGGAKKDALPWPFAHIGDLASAASKQLPMHPSDLWHKTNPNEPFAAWSEMQTQIKAGTISAAIVDQTNMSPYGAFDERFMIEVG